MDDGKKEAFGLMLREAYHNINRMMVSECPEGCAALMWLTEEEV